MVNLCSIQENVAKDFMSKRIKNTSPQSSATVPASPKAPTVDALTTYVTHMDVGNAE